MCRLHVTLITIVATIRAFVHSETIMRFNRGKFKHDLIPDSLEKLSEDISAGRGVHVSPARVNKEIVTSSSDTCSFT